MLGAVDLHELAYAVPAIARLVHGLEPLLAVAPETVSQHPLPKRLDPEMDAVSLSQLLAGQRRAEVGVVGLDQGQDLGPQRRRIATIAGLAAACRDQRRRPALPIRLGQPEHVTTRQPHQLGSLTRRNPASRHVPEDMHAVDLSAAHRNHRHQSRAPNRWTAREARTIMERKSTAARVTDRREAGAGPSGQTYFRSSHQARRVTSETGTRVTSLSGVYRHRLHKRLYGTW